MEHITYTESSWAPSQRQANVQAVVMNDEEYTGLRQRGLEYHAGIGPNELRYRRVILHMTHSEGGRPTLGFKGMLKIIAIVPDGMPLLKMGDIVEARFPKMYDSLKDFSQTGEGNAVLRLLCPADNNTSDEIAAVKNCARELSWHKGWGEGMRYFEGIAAAPSSRPFATSLKDHAELSFSPYYDTEGQPMASAVVAAPRPSLRNWPMPKKY